MNHWTRNYCEEENNLFFKNVYSIDSLFTFFKKAGAIGEFGF